MSKGKSGQALLENARVQEFIRTVRSQCRKCNVQFSLAPANMVGRQGKGDCRGYFQEPCGSTGSKENRHVAGMLKVATVGHPVSEWICTLAHEYAHFLQWFRDDPVYTLDDYTEMEIATEREAIEILKRFRIPLDYGVVKRKSDAYIARLRRAEAESNK
jgi:hypothetical protein